MEERIRWLILGIALGTVTTKDFEKKMKRKMTKEEEKLLKETKRDIEQDKANDIKAVYSADYD